MADRAHFSVDFDGTDLTDETLDDLVERLDFGGWDRYRHRWDGERMIEDPAMNCVQIEEDEHPCGEAGAVAETVLAWMREDTAARLRAFTVTEDGAYGYMGACVTFDPAIHGPEDDRPAYHEAPYLDGSSQLNAGTAARLIAESDGSYEALVLALGAHYGPDFDALVTAETAKRRATAAAREAEAIAARVRECGYPEPPAERIPEEKLTLTQRAALAALRRRRNLWPAGRGRWSSGNETPWEQRTLDALVRAGHARWIIYAGHGCLPHIVPA